MLAHVTGSFGAFISDAPRPEGSHDAVPILVIWRSKVCTSGVNIVY
jgi:hypothetical protein